MRFETPSKIQLTLKWQIVLLLKKKNLLPSGCDYLLNVMMSPCELLTIINEQAVPFLMITVELKKTL